MYGLGYVRNMTTLQKYHETIFVLEWYVNSIHSFFLPIFYLDSKVDLTKNSFM